MLKNKVIVCVFAVFAIISQGESDGTDEVSVSVMEGNSVTLHANVTINQQDRIMWYLNGSRIAHIYGDQSKICTDEPCEKRFRDRLKVDNHKGDLTITNIRNADSGVYQLTFSRSGKIFSVSVSGVSAIRDEMKIKSVKEGESVTLETPEGKNPNDVMTWYFNDILIAEITEDQSKICTDDQCDGTFRDRLKVNRQTGSLTITNTRTTDSGLYKVEIIISHSSFSITSIKSFSVTVTDSGLSTGAIAGISFGVLLVAAAVAGGIYYNSRSVDKGKNMKSPPYEVLQNDGERPNDWRGSK